jgi:hypothetical protein
MARYAEHIQYPSEVLATRDLELTALTAEQISYINGTIDF